MKYAILLLCVIVKPAFADLYAYIHATADETGQIMISGDVYNGPIDPVPEEFVDLVIVRSTHGTCSEPVMITSQAWPIPDSGRREVIEWTENAPQANIMYRYEYKARDHTGQLHTIGGWPYNRAYTSFGEAVATRGRFSIFMEFVACEEGCWDIQDGCVSEDDMTAIDQEQLITWIWTKQVLDIYGPIHLDEMFPNCSIDISGIEEHDGDCGPVPNRTMTWGYIKATYR